MIALLDMPVELMVRGLYDAMNGFGTDEYTLSAIVGTLPENMYGEIHAAYKQHSGKKLVDHIESETSFSYKKCLMYQAMDWAESRATALNAAMVGMGTSEDQLIRVVICSTFKERQIIRDTYARMFSRDLIEHIESETSKSFKNILVAVLKSTRPRASFDWDQDCDKLKKALEGKSSDEKVLIQIVSSKTPQQIEELKNKYEEKHGEILLDRIEEYADDQAGLFGSSNFRDTIVGLLRDPMERLAYCVRDCINGWGTDNTGLITLLVHLSERKRRDLVEKYRVIKDGGDLIERIKGDTSGDFERALLALVKPPPQVWADAIESCMAGLGTSDGLLINWMCISKERMDEVREAYLATYDRELWGRIKEDCSGDYADTLMRLANRRCDRFSGKEVMLSIPPPASKIDAVLKFTKSFNKLMKLRKEKGEDIVPTEEEQQEMGSAFLYFGSTSSCAPNIDIPGLWALTNAVGFPPGDDGPDLVATFDEWDVSGTGEITWNDFVREMTTRINDPTHFDGAPLPATIDQIGELPDVPLNDGWQTMAAGATDDGWETGAKSPRKSKAKAKRKSAKAKAKRKSLAAQFDPKGALLNGTWKEALANVPPKEEDGLLIGPWAYVLEEATLLEQEGGWEDKFPDAPVGCIITYMEELGLGDFIGAAERREQACRNGEMLERQVGRSAGVDMKAAMENGTWKDILAKVPPKEEDGALTGYWGYAIEEAVALEQAGAPLAGSDEAPVGAVITYMEELGHGDLIPAAEQREAAAKEGAEML